MDEPKVDFVLNVFRRPESIASQIEAIRSQTFAPNEIFIWENGEARVPEHLADQVTVVRANRNLGVWSRFTLALNSKADFICMLDDDTIPGPKWIQNCLSSMSLEEGLYGTRGLIFDSKFSYSLNSDVGLHKPNNSIQRVDIVGHAWFFRRQWLGEYWSEYKNAFPEDLAGEDIHFSYALQKHLGLPTLVPPHPADDLEMWGSQPETAKSLGGSDVAISKGAKSMDKFERALRHYRSKGFRVLSELPGVTVPKRHNLFVYLVVGRNSSSLHRLAKVIRRFRKGTSNR